MNLQNFNGTLDSLKWRFKESERKPSLGAPVLFKVTQIIFERNCRKQVYLDFVRTMIDSPNCVTSVIKPIRTLLRVWPT